DHDKLYAFLSATGSHPQTRGLMGRARFDEQGGTAGFSMFGTGDRTTPNVLVVRAAVAVAMKIAEVFAKRMIQEDVPARITSLQKALSTLTDEYLQPMAAQIRIDAEELRLVLGARMK